MFTCGPFLDRWVLPVTQGRTVGHVEANRLRRLFYEGEQRNDETYDGLLDADGR